MTPDTRTTENPKPRTVTGKEFAESLRNHDTPHPMAGKRRPINEWIAAIEAEAAHGAAPRAEGLLSEIEAHVNAQTVEMGRMWASGAHYVLRSIRRGSAEERRD